jgi:hypothetical protein
MKNAALTQGRFCCAFTYDVLQDGAYTCKTNAGLKEGAVSSVGTKQAADCMIASSEDNPTPALGAATDEAGGITKATAETALEVAKSLPSKKIADRLERNTDRLGASDLAQTTTWECTGAITGTCSGDTAFAAAISLDGAALHGTDEESKKADCFTRCGAAMASAGLDASQTACCAFTYDDTDYSCSTSAGSKTEQAAGATTVLAADCTPVT